MDIATFHCDGHFSYRFFVIFFGERRSSRHSFLKVAITDTKSKTKNQKKKAMERKEENMAKGESVLKSVGEKRV